MVDMSSPRMFSHDSATAQTQTFQISDEAFSQSFSAVFRLQNDSWSILLPPQYQAAFVDDRLQAKGRNLYAGVMEANHREQDHSPSFGAFATMVGHTASLIP
jgi:hypothetical protein